MNAERPANVGLLGCGVVGGGVADRLLRGFRVGSRRFQLGSALVRDLRKPREPPHVRPHLTTLVERVLHDNPLDVVVECLGGVEPAGTYVEAALRLGIPVITANKALIAERGARLHAIAEDYGAQLAYEAAVGGATPILRTLHHLASTDEILEIGGIVNGTTNFVLSAMEEGLTLAEALEDAQRAGFAESDPTTDLEGIDAAHKLCILTAAAFGTWPRWESIARRGIKDVTRDDLELARRRNCRIKLAAWTRRAATGTDAGTRILAAVGPTFIPNDHPFAAPRGAENVILIVARYAGPILIGGLGAGREPTASAVMADLADIIGATSRLSIGTGALEKESINA